ncbi:MAG: hypothetical protein H7Y86_14515 [Rhizobacter sp.]|nr:hypothetical protein [Ferruginibacter sp.]
MKKFKKISLRILTSLLLLYLLLLIPDGKRDTPVNPGRTAFVWNKDSLWSKLEKDFQYAKSLQASQLDSSIAILKNEAESQFAYIDKRQQIVSDTNLDGIQLVFFSLAPLMATKPMEELAWYINYYSRIREYVKDQSIHWDMQQPVARDKIYSLLYGMRAAIEEVVLQSDLSKLPHLMLAKHEPSVTPVAKIFGTFLHSGDILVSRGGAEVSALISRANDYPGNFSHIALLYVDEKTNKPFFIEAHIEKGLAIASATEYAKDKKLRCMLMRPRAGLPAMIANPMLPHQAAKKMYEESLTRHIPYDFKMNYMDSAAMFCSEVASYAYKKKDVQLWPTLSTISSPGIVNWLNDFGVENFITQMPSDLEYDPQLSIVAEWRDPETLFKDHIDNAVTDAMLEKANKGEKIGYDHWQLPFVRVIKAWCVIENWFGKEGIIPEGMSATTALKNQRYVAMNKKINVAVQQMAEDFRKQYHYRPPYWQLAKFANTAGNK